MVSCCRSYKLGIDTEREHARASDRPHPTRAVIETLEARRLLSGDIEGGTLYANRFESATSAIGSEWSAGDMTLAQANVKRTPSGERVLGEFGGSMQDVTLTLDTDFPHRLITVGYDLIITRSWDGAEEITDATPDVLTVGVKKTDVGGADEMLPLMKASFHNDADAGQVAVGTITDVDGVEADVELIADEVNTLGYDTVTDLDTADATYSLSHTFSHTGPLLEWNLASNIEQQFADESWSIDNVVVTWTNVAAVRVVPHDSGPTLSTDDGGVEATQYLKKNETFDQYDAGVTGLGDDGPLRDGEADPDSGFSHGRTVLGDGADPSVTRDEDVRYFDVVLTLPGGKEGPNGRLAPNAKLNISSVAGYGFDPTGSRTEQSAVRVYTHWPEGDPSGNDWRLELDDWDFQNHLHSLPLQPVDDQDLPTGTWQRKLTVAIEGVAGGSDDIDFTLLPTRPLRASTLANSPLPGGGDGNGGETSSSGPIPGNALGTDGFSAHVLGFDPDADYNLDGQIDRDRQADYNEDKVPLHLQGKQGYAEIDISALPPDHMISFNTAPCIRVYAVLNDGSERLVSRNFSRHFFHPDEVGLGTSTDRPTQQSGVVRLRIEEDYAHPNHAIDIQIRPADQVSEVYRTSTSGEPRYQYYAFSAGTTETPEDWVQDDDDRVIELSITPLDYSLDLSWRDIYDSHSVTVEIDHDHDGIIDESASLPIIENGLRKPSLKITDVPAHESYSYKIVLKRADGSITASSSYIMARAAGQAAPPTQASSSGAGTTRYGHKEDVILAFNGTTIGGIETTGNFFFRNHVDRLEEEVLLNGKTVHRLEPVLGRGYFDFDKGRDGTQALLDFIDGKDGSKPDNSISEAEAEIYNIHVLGYSQGAVAAVNESNRIALANPYRRSGDISKYGSWTIQSAIPVASLTSFDPISNGVARLVRFTHKPVGSHVEQHMDY